MIYLLPTYLDITVLYLSNLWGRDGSSQPGIIIYCLGVDHMNYVLQPPDVGVTFDPPNDRGTGLLQMILEDGSDCILSNFVHVKSGYTKGMKYC